jgi:hypothetical protein
MHLGVTLRRRWSARRGLLPATADARRRDADLLPVIPTQVGTHDLLLLLGAELWVFAVAQLDQLSSRLFDVIRRERESGP